MSAQDWSRVRKGGSKSANTVAAKAIPISCIINYYGGEVREGREVPVRCAFHNDSRRSASINTIDNLYFCHTCGKGGNAVNIVCTQENLEFKDGLKRALEIAQGSGAPIRTGNNSGSNRRASRTWDI